MSILTKEVIQKILNDDWLLMDDCEGLENCTVIKELARMALAAMDSEPVAWLWSRDGDAERDVSLTPPDDDDDAAMLNHPSSIQPNTDAAPGTEIKHPSSNSPVIGIDPASGPDRTVEVRYVAPPGYVMVPKEPTAEMQSAGASAIRIETTALNKLWTGNAVFRAMLAAAQQEVKGE
ncbi:hypothetical protein [Klebsiella michiganensis]|uniref:hypothetical protein n=1 Tax=Klebsiella michiganensis TaxID=1134687 RepID=UPI001D0E74F5|nr:hypothetical protein [Klebsiella michiganensis]